MQFYPSLLFKNDLILRSDDSSFSLNNFKRLPSQLFLSISNFPTTKGFPNRGDMILNVPIGLI